MRLTLAALLLCWGVVRITAADDDPRIKRQEARTQLQEAVKARAQSDPVFQQYINSIGNAPTAASENTQMTASPTLQGGQAAPAGSAQLQGLGAYVYPWPHNNVPNPAVGFNPAVNYDLPNFAQSPNIRKFMDSLPGLGYANRNNLGQYIPVAVPDTTKYAGSDYYVIGAKQFSQKMHTDLPPTLIRGYEQINSTDPTIGNVTQYLGPAIIARVYDPTRPAGVIDAKGTNGKPVRVLFENLMPLSNAGKLFLPVDMTIMGAGMGPTTGQNFTDNRTTIPHLHGGHTPWISDGTPHQWITPANDPTIYKKGASVVNVPDMVGTGKSIPVPAAGDGLATLYWSNQQSSRLMFYHDHAWGITRLNVYAGMAAPYLLVDQVEDDLISGTNLSGGNPAGIQILPDQAGLDNGTGNYRYGIPLVIQDKSFVNDATTPLAAAVAAFPGGVYSPTFKTADVDPLWATYVGTGGGNLWLPHEYMPVENVFDTTGGTVPVPGGGTFSWSAGNTTNGRWDYAPFMIPPAMPQNLTLPSPTITPEGFCDTAVINGTAFPYLNLPPDTVRFRILSVGNERTFNLQLYKAEPLTLRVTSGGSNYSAGTTVSIAAPPAGGTQATATCTVTNGVITGITVTNPGSGYALSPAPGPAVNFADPLHTGSGAFAYATVATEVKMVDAAPNPAYPTWPKDGRDGGVPDPTTAGPDWYMIGNESGFMAQVADFPAQPVDYEYVRQNIPFAGVTSHSLLLLPAERADVVVDLRGYQDGDVLILYNDAPAPMPMFWALNDYYTDDPDQRIVGGPTPTPPGFGPNTRTLMQIRITGTKTSAFNFSLANLQTALPKAFAVAQPKPIAPQLVYNAAFPGFAAGNMYMQAPDSTMNLSGAGQSISRIMTTMPGNNYTTAPTVTIIGGGGSGATATAGLNPVTAIQLTAAGTGYTTVPTVTLTAPQTAGGVPATAVATISGGTVASISIMEPGSGYTAAPTITVTGGGGTGAAATASITLNAVGSITITNAGSGYTSEPRVYLTGGGGTGAMAVALLNGATIMTTKNITEGFDREYGRMDIRMGSTPNMLTPNVGAGLVVGMAQYVDPPTELLNDGETTLWRITHIGVDSHALHFHLFDVQVVNRVDWTNVVKPPYPDEIGWRETIRTNPLEDILVAFRPKSMVLPFQIPNSSRLLDPSAPVNSTANFSPVAPAPGVTAVAQVTNVTTNFYWEYVWHCHMLSHEENDFMRPMCLIVVPPPAPTGLAATVAFPTTTTASVGLTWAGTFPTADGFTIQRATNTGFTAGLTTFTMNGNSPNAYTDSTVAMNTAYYYRVAAWNGAGSSPWSNVVNIATVPPPSAFAATVTAGRTTRRGRTTTKSDTVRLTWTASGTISNFTIQRSTTTAFTTVTSATATSTARTLSQTVTAPATYYYRIRTNITGGSSNWSPTLTVTAP